MCCTQGTNYFLVFNYGNNMLAQMGGHPVAVLREVKHGDIYDFNVNLVAPKEPGRLPIDSVSSHHQQAISSYLRDEITLYSN